jgi:hypothetical protein
MPSMTTLAALVTGGRAFTLRFALHHLVVGRNQGDSVPRRSDPPPRWAG